MSAAKEFAARAILAEQGNRHDAAHTLRMAAIDMGMRFANAPHDPSRICGECYAPALADGSTLGGAPICGVDLDDYYAEMGMQL